MPQDVTFPSTPAAAVEEAEERLLTLLEGYVRMGRYALPEGQDAGLVKMVGEMNLWTNIMQVGVGLAYTAVTGKPVPDRYAASDETMSLWGDRE